MPKKLMRLLTFAAVLQLGLPCLAQADEVDPGDPQYQPTPQTDIWQYYVNNDDKGHMRGFLWIPPQCKYVRGVILGQQVILEHLMLEDPQVRAAAAREGLAIVLLSSFNIGYKIDDPTQALLDHMLAQFADMSGYSEIAKAPLLTIGHSGGGIWTWNIAYRNPTRTFGLVTIGSAAISPPDWLPKASVDGIPTLSITGQYESWGVAKPAEVQKPAEHHWRWLRGDLLSMRGRNLGALNSELVEPGGTHFGWKPETAHYVGMFIEKAAHYRIPATPPADGQPVQLKPLSLESGWLQDCMFMRPSRYAPAPYASYEGDPYLAMWHMDGDLAKANDDFDRRDKGKKLQMVTFLKPDETPNDPAWIQGLDFNPLPDGMTVKVKADFVKETPPELSFPTKQELGHADGPIRFKLIGGWTGGNEQTGPDTFRIRMDRLGYTRGFGSLMIMAYQMGDDQYAYCEQSVGIGFKDNSQGNAQTITFPSIPDQRLGAKEIELKATSDSGLPVDYFVLAGPAYIQGGKLILTDIPVRAKLPITVTVVASQWGRIIEPKVQTAKPVVQTFQIQ